MCQLAIYCLCDDGPGPCKYFCLASWQEVLRLSRVKGDRRGAALAQVPLCLPHRLLQTLPPHSAHAGFLPHSATRQ